MGKTRKNNKKQALIAASYARKSDPNQEGIEDQHALNVAEAAKHGFIIPKEYQFGDDNTSGDTTSRVELDQLSAIIESGDHPLSRVYSLDKKRLGRFQDPGYHDYLRIHFAKHDVELWYSRDANPDYSQGMTPENRVHAMNDRFDSINANTEKYIIRERTMRGARNRVKRGFYPGTSAPYGTVRCLAMIATRNILQDVPEGQRLRMQGGAYLLRWSDDGSRQVIVDIFNMLEIEGFSFQRIASVLNDSGIKPPRRPKRKKKSDYTKDVADGEEIHLWTATAVRYVAQNPIYRGDLEWGRTTRDGAPVDASIADPDGSEPIIYRGFISNPPVTREQFDRVQRIIEERRVQLMESRRSTPEYVLSGRLVCAVCGAPWAGFTSWKGENRRRRYYRHGPTPGADRTPGGSMTIDCSSKSRYVRCAPLEQQVISKVLDIICTEDLERAIAEELTHQQRAASDPAIEKRVGEIEATIPKVQRWIDNATKAISQSEDPDVQASSERVRADHSAHLKSLRYELAELKEAKDRAQQATVRLAEMLKETKSLMDGFYKASHSRQKRILRNVVASIQLDADSGTVEVCLRLAADSPGQLPHLGETGS